MPELIQVTLSHYSMKDSFVGIYDGPDRDPRKNLVQIAFLCRIVGGESRPVAKNDALESLSEAEVKDLQMAFDRKQTN